MLVSVRIPGGKYRIYRTAANGLSDSPTVRSADAISIDKALPSLPIDAQLLGTSDEPQGTIVQAAGRGVTTFAVLGLIGAGLWWAFSKKGVR